jgi:hypothetical protein
VPLRQDVTVCIIHLLYSTKTWDKSSRATNNIAMLLASYEVHAQSYYVVLMPGVVARRTWSFSMYYISY